MKANILWVNMEPTPQIKKAISTFKYVGYKVTPCEKKQGWKKFTSSYYDLIIITIDALDVSGFRLISKIRREDKKRPILLAVANDRICDGGRGLRLGANFFFTTTMADIYWVVYLIEQHIYISIYGEPENDALTWTP